MLRSGILASLTNAGVRTVIFFPMYPQAADIPDALRREFEGPLVTLVGVREKPLGRAYKLFGHLVKFLVYTQSTWTFCLVSVKHDKQRADALAYLQKWIYTPLSKIGFLKRLARAIEYHVFRHRLYGEYFDAYAPDAVFSTSIISTLDILFMKEARRRGITTISIPKGWDNVAKLFYRFIPDVLLVQNEHMTEAAVKLQGVLRERIRVVGFPQFDWYVRQELQKSREAYCERMGLDPARRIILFGSEGKWAPSDYTAAERIGQLIQTDGALAVPCTLLIRPHFSDSQNPRFAQRNFGPNIVVDTSMTRSDFFFDRWDPGNDETELFLNTLHHMDVLVTTTSTLTLDAVCFDKPILNIAYEILYKNGKDVSELFYQKDHYQWVLRTGAVDLVRSDEELRARLNDALREPAQKAAARQRLRDEVCYRVDGQSSRRVADEILSVLNNTP